LHLYEYLKEGLLFLSLQMVLSLGQMELWEVVAPLLAVVVVVGALQSLSY